MLYTTDIIGSWYIQLLTVSRSDSVKYIYNFPVKWDVSLKQAIMYTKRTLEGTILGQGNTG